MGTVLRNTLHPLSKLLSSLASSEYGRGYQQCGTGSSRDKVGTMEANNIYQ
jgi:hypothetical protein